MHDDSFLPTSLRMTIFFKRKERCTLVYYLKLYIEKTEGDISSHFVWQFYEMWELQTTSLSVWRFTIDMQLICINPYLESLLYFWHDIISSLLLQTYFDSLMEQNLVNISQRVNNNGVKAWNTTLRNVTIIHHMYALTNAQQRHVSSNDSHKRSL